jgi:hypothetical protein
MKPFNKYQWEHLTKSPDNYDPSLILQPERRPLVPTSIGISEGFYTPSERKESLRKLKSSILDIEEVREDYLPEQPCSGIFCG